MTFFFDVKGDTITHSGSSHAFSGGLNYYHCSFSFSPEWDGLDKFVVFRRGDTSFTAVLSGTSCPIPQEVMETVGTLEIGVFGTAVGSGNVFRITTDFSHIVIKEGAYCRGTAPDVPSPDDWEEYICAIADKAAENAIGEIGNIEEALNGIIDIQKSLTEVTQ